MSLSAREIVVFVEIIVASEFAWVSVYTLHATFSITARQLDVHHDLSPLINKNTLSFEELPAATIKRIKCAPSLLVPVHLLFLRAAAEKQGLNSETCLCRVLSFLARFRSSANARASARGAALSLQTFFCAQIDFA